MIDTTRDAAIGSRIHTTDPEASYVILDHIGQGGFTCEEIILASRVLLENEKEPVMLSEAFAPLALSWRLVRVDAEFVGQFPGIGSGFHLRGHRVRLSIYHAIVQVL